MDDKTLLHMFAIRKWKGDDGMRSVVQVLLKRFGFEEGSASVHVHRRFCFSRALERAAMDTIGCNMVNALSSKHFSWFSICTKLSFGTIQKAH